MDLPKWLAKLDQAYCTSITHKNRHPFLCSMERMQKTTTFKLLSWCYQKINQLFAKFLGVLYNLLSLWNGWLFSTTTSWQCILRSAEGRSIRFMVYMNSAHLICQGFFAPTSQVFRDLTKYWSSPHGFNTELWSGLVYIKGNVLRTYYPCILFSLCEDSWKVLSGLSNTYHHKKGYCL